jgi:hypothetical protein
MAQSNKDNFSAKFATKTAELILVTAKKPM